MDSEYGIKLSDASDAGELLLACALDIGAEMLINGAEISRVEDSISRICRAYGAEEINAFSITYVILVTIYYENEGYITQSRRIESFKYDLHKLEYLNNLSRNICSFKPDMNTVKNALKSAKGLEGASPLRILLGYGMISSAFTIFFGGSTAEAVSACIIGFMMYVCETLLKKVKMNKFLSPCVCAGAAGILTVLFVKFNIGEAAENISIGNIMVLIPGLMITNSFRDLFSGNIISGLVRFMESVLLSIAIALGMSIGKWIL